MERVPATNAELEDISSLEFSSLTEISGENLLAQVDLLRAATAQLLKPNGEFVAITPRSRLQIGNVQIIVRANGRSLLLVYFIDLKKAIIQADLKNRIISRT